MFWLVFTRAKYGDKNCRGVYTSRARAVTALRKIYEGELNSEYSALEGCKYAFKAPSDIWAWRGNFASPDSRWRGWIEKRRGNIDWGDVPLFPRKNKLKIIELDTKEYQRGGGMHFTPDGEPIPVREWEKSKKI